MDIKRISVIGLGQMGTSLATVLLKVGYEVTGFDLVENQIANLVPLGLKPAKCPKDTAGNADLFILSLPNWEAVLNVTEGEEGILAGARPGQIIIDTSTVLPWETKPMADRLALRGIEWMDVPISGTAEQVRVGNMVFMAAGKESAYAQIKPVLDKISKKTVYVGKNGDGAMLKLIVNQIFYLNQASAIEGFVHGLKAGINPEAMLEVLNSSEVAASALIATRGEHMLQGNFVKKGPIRLALTTTSCILESAKRLGVMLPMLALYQQFFFQAHYNGWDDLDQTVVMKIYEQMARVERKNLNHED